MVDPKPTMLDPEDEDFDYETVSAEEEVQEEEVSEEEEELQMAEIKKGAIYGAEVVRLEDDHALVDFGGPADGVLPFDKLHEGGVSVGDKKYVKIIETEHRDNLPLLSEKEAVADRSWAKIKAAHENGDVLEGKIFKKIKGGFLVQLFEHLTSFMPYSHLSLSHKKNTDKYIDRSFKLKVLEYDREEENVVVSRREFLEQERQKEQQEFFEDISIGDWVEGRVKNIVNFGAFVDLGPVDGLLHKSDVAWGPVRDVGDYVEMQKKIEVKVLDMDREEGKVSLGLKQKYPDPWENIDEKYSEGDITTGEIVDVWSDGVFIRLERDVEGKVPEDELSWAKTWDHPEEQFAEGDKMEVKIVSIDKQRRHVLLSHKQTQKNPWEVLQKRFPVGTVLAAPVVDITPNDIKVQLLENVRGRIQKRNIQWEDKEVDLFDQFKIGQQVKCKVLAMDPNRQRVELGIKQMLPNPWVKKVRKYPVGSTVEGKVTSVLQFGAFVKIDKDLEGLVHVSEMADGKRVNPYEEISEGEKVKVKVIGVDEDERKIDLSIKEYEKERAKEQMEEYMEEEGGGGDGITFGDLLGDELPNAMKG